VNLAENIKKIPGAKLLKKWGVEDRSNGKEFGLNQ